MDGDVDITDFAILKTNFHTGGCWAEGDFDGDGDVDITDFAILKQNFGSSSAAVPEPASATILLLGTIAVLRRRKK